MPITLYKRLNLSKQDFKKLLVKEYKDNKLSQEQIAVKLDCHVSSIEQWFKKFHIAPRSQSEALANRWRKTASLTQIEKEQIMGWLLSDGTLDASAYSARFTIGLKHKSVLEAIKKSLSSLNFTPIWTSDKTKCSHMKSHSYVDLKDLYDEWYCNGRKRLPTTLSLSPVMVYYWFIGDGSRVPFGIQLSTESFSKTNIERLSKMLHELGFENTVLKSNRIRIKSGSIKSFYEYIGDCKHKAYEYKWRLAK